MAPPGGTKKAACYRMQVQRVLRPFGRLAADGRWAGGRGKDGCPRGARPGRFCRVEQRDLGRAFCLEVDVSGGVAFLARGDDVTAGRHAPDPRHAAHFSFLPLAFLSRYVCVDIGGVGCHVFSAVVLGWCRRRRRLLPGGLVCCCCCWSQEFGEPPTPRGGRWRRKLKPKASSLRTAGPSSPGGWPR